MVKIGEFESYWNETSCATCSYPGNIDPSHIESRSQAPDRIYDPRNVIPQCRTCHKAKDEGDMLLAQMSDGTLVWTNTKTGETGRRHNPRSEAAQEADLAMESNNLAAIAEVLPFLPDWALSPILDELWERREIGWLAQGAFFSEIKQRCYGKDWAHAAAKRFNTSASTVRNKARVWEVFFEDNIPRQQQREQLPHGFWLKCAGQPDPDAALEMALELKAENPLASVEELAARLGRPTPPRPGKCGNCNHVFDPCPECGYSQQEENSEVPRE